MSLVFTEIYAEDIRDLPQTKNVIVVMLFWTYFTSASPWICSFLHININFLKKSRTKETPPMLQDQSTFKVKIIGYLREDL